jgi:hypothetical protein
MPADADKPRDGLEGAGVRAGPALVISAVLLVFLAVTLAALAGYFRLMVPAPASPPPRPDPVPQLETSIDPRSLPSALPVAMPAPKPAQPLDEATLQRAMAVVAARGPQAYDPPPATGAGR